MTRNVAVVDQGEVDQGEVDQGRWKISLASATAPLREEGVDA